MKKWVLFRNIGTILTLSGVAQKNGRHIKLEDLSPVSQAALVVREGRVEWVGPQKSIPAELRKIKNQVDLHGQTVIPGFVECHTHTVFMGSRADEFELRNQGETYQKIAAQGGGILRTVQATREASAAKLKSAFEQRVREFVKQGVVALECKSGYGLDLETEIKCLRVIKSIDSIRMVPTFLGPHALPPEYHSASEYLEYLGQKVLPQVIAKDLSRRADIFIEKGFFSLEEGRKYLLRARKLGFDLIIHADQLSLNGGADLALELGACSADHLVNVGEKEIKKLGQSSIVCVLLPCADLYMRCDYPPARKLIDSGACVALATDFNPGTCPTQDLSLVGLLARLEMKMSLPEVIAAYTYNSARALGLSEELGSLQIGKRADFICIQEDWRELFYRAGTSLVQTVYRAGESLKWVA